LALLPLPPQRRCCVAAAAGCWLLPLLLLLLLLQRRETTLEHKGGCSRRVNRNAVVIGDLFLTAQRASFFDTPARCKKRVAGVLSYKRVTFEKKAFSHKTSEDAGRIRGIPWRTSP